MIEEWKVIRRRNLGKEEYEVCRYNPELMYEEIVGNFDERLRAEEFANALNRNGGDTDGET